MRQATSTRMGAVVVALGLMAGCSGDDGEGAPSTTMSVPTTSTTVPSVNPTVQVFFVDEDAFNIGRPPYVTPVERTVEPDDPARGALDALFAGPTEEERAAGLRLVASEATGVADLRIDDGTAHVTLAGGCASGGSTLTVAAEIIPTLLQFEGVQAVKIYDPAGFTEFPDDPGDSIPECLEP